MTRHQRAEATKRRRMSERRHWRGLEWARRQFAHLASEDSDPPDGLPGDSETEFLAELHFEQRLLHRRL